VPSFAKRFRKGGGGSNGEWTSIRWTYRKHGASRLTVRYSSARSTITFARGKRVAASLRTIS
jgi:hypothetical protein